MVIYVGAGIVVLAIGTEFGKPLGWGPSGFHVEPNMKQSSQVILLMAEILHLLIDRIVYSIIYKVSYISGGDRRISEPSTVWLRLHSQVFSWSIDVIPNEVMNPRNVNQRYPVKLDDRYIHTTVILTNDGCYNVSPEPQVGWEKYITWCTLYYERFWPNGITFHQPRFPWNKGISLTITTICGEVVWGRQLIWPEDYFSFLGKKWTCLEDMAWFSTQVNGEALSYWMVVMPTHLGSNITNTKGCTVRTLSLSLSPE